MTQPAAYRCLDCGHTWEIEIPVLQTKPPFSCGSDPCPRCGHPYMEWINYEAMATAGRRGFGHD